MESERQGATEVDYEHARVFTCYPLITFFAKDEEEAARMLFALDETINALPGTSTMLDEECYERVSDEQPDEPWHPVIPEVTSG